MKAQVDCFHFRIKTGETSLLMNTWHKEKIYYELKISASKY